MHNTNFLNKHMTISLTLLKNAPNIVLLLFHALFIYFFLMWYFNYALLTELLYCTKIFKPNM